MKPQKSIMFFFLMVVFTLSGFSLEPGDTVPKFSVVSGSGQILINNDLKDKTIALFYEDRSQMDLNQELKVFLSSQSFSKDRTQMVVIVDCSDVGLFKKMWEDKLVDYSRKNHYSTYGDWNGKMKERFQFQDNTSTFLVVDTLGKIVFIKSGEINPNEFSQISGFIE